MPAYFLVGCFTGPMTGMRRETTDCEYGTAACEAVDWLVGRGYLRRGDCAMNVACGRGGFAGPMCREVRVLVCMDRDPKALEITGARCAGGCRTELFERDWDGYAPSRGRYDVCLISPSRLCYTGSSLARLETVSSRSCVAVLPVEHGYRRLKKIVLKSIGAQAGFQGLPDYPDARPFGMWLRNKGRDYETDRFACVISCASEDVVDCLAEDSVRLGADPEAARRVAEAIVSSLSSGGRIEYGFTAQVYAWDVG